MSPAKNSTEQELQQFENESRVSQQMGAYITCLITAYIGVALRVLCRRMKRMPLRIDDWLILVSLFFTTAFASIDISLTRDGLGRHEKFITNPEYFALGILTGEALYSLAIFMVKMSILFLLDHIIPKKHFRYALWVTGSIISLYTLVQIVCVIVHCIPFTALWTPTVQAPAHCINLDDVILVCSSLNIATDVAILILPMPEFWNLQITTKQKLQVTFLFLLGGLVCIFSSVRITKLPGNSRIDPGWTLVSSAIWSVVERCIATLSACLPTMRPLYEWLFGSNSIGIGSEISGGHAGWPSSPSGLQKAAAFRTTTHVDTWPLRALENVSRAYISMEMNPIHENEGDRVAKSGL